MGIYENFLTAIWRVEFEMAKSAGEAKRSFLRNLHILMKNEGNKQ